MAKVFTTLSKIVCFTISVTDRVSGVVQRQLIPGLAAIAKRKMALIRTVDLPFTANNLD